MDGLASGPLVVMSVWRARCIILVSRYLISNGTAANRPLLFFLSLARSAPRKIINHVEDGEKRGVHKETR